MGEPRVSDERLYEWAIRPALARRSDRIAVRYDEIGPIARELLDLRADLSASQQRGKELEVGLRDAIDGMNDMIGYVPEYFVVEKWGHEDYIARARSLLTKETP